MKIISNRLYKEYTKELIGFHQYIPNITKEQLYDVFKFHCANLRVLNEVVEYYSNLQQENERLRQKINKTIDVIDEILVYNDFGDTTSAFGNAPEKLKFYLSDCETLEEFRSSDK